MADVMGSAAESRSNNAVTLDSLQQKIVCLLDEINLLIDQTQAHLDKATETKYCQFKMQIAAARQNVADLKLRMAIVAPMKAGKSTIINAIAGQELLPNCAVAMTTIPTEIIFTPNIKQPILYLSPNTIELFQSLEIDVKNQVQQQGFDSLKQRLKLYPHLLELYFRWS